ncbi:MAG: carbon storage regulator [Patescibacteria group bacterium]
MNVKEGLKSIPAKVVDAAKKLHEDEDGMLILTRKVDQGIVISGNILVRVLGVERDRVKIGISAPGEITVLRQELWHEGEEDQAFERKDRSARSQTEITATLPIPKSKKPPQG